MNAELGWFHPVPYECCDYNPATKLYKPNKEKLDAYYGRSGLDFFGDMPKILDNVNYASIAYNTGKFDGRD